MKIGISALLFNLEEALDLCEKEKIIEHIELGIDNLEECKLLYKYKSRIEALNLSIGIHLPMELNICENINYIKESWQKFIISINVELKEFNIRYFNIHLGYVISSRLKKDREKYLELSSKFLNEVGNNIDTNIYIENTYSKGGDFSNVGNIVSDFEYIFNKIDKNNLGFCYDTGHNLLDSDEYITKLKNKIKLVHLSDNDGIDDIHIGIGKGILSKEHIKEVLELNSCYLILEIDYKHIEDSIKKLEDIIREV
ncbi:MAG: sugar phosphate isomerase/epimerase family protein [Romboutsia sp.]|uniref:sugar phosphate isomerase/epimerase family protein n=1 Tax=Romboutsia sp. TaxID=1965302 RepID=UPI003F2CF8FC